MRTMSSCCRSTTATAERLRKLLRWRASLRPPPLWPRLSVLPMAARKAPATVVGFPVIGRPVIAAHFGHPAALNPHVPTTVPVPIARCPYKADSRRRHFHDLRRRRGDIDYRAVISRPRTRSGHGRRTAAEQEGGDNRCLQWGHTHNFYLLH